MGKRATIGLILAQAPGYSETFLMNKIRGLEASGFRVIVFGDKVSSLEVKDIQEVNGFTLPPHTIGRIIKGMLVMLYLTFRCPVRCYLYYCLERRTGTSIGSISRSLFTSAHILPHSVNYLHFGFATLGVGRENLGRAIGAKVSTSFRGYDISIYPLKRPDVYLKLWKVLNKVHTISDDLYHEALALGLPSNVHCIKIMPAIDAKKFLHARDFNQAHNVVKILTVARMQWKKGLEVALDAMAMLKSQGISFQYTIVGVGADFERISFARHQLGLEVEVIFAGKKSHDEIALLMREHEVYLQPSLQEGFCNSVLEAQASGLLCIVTNAEGLSENVLNERTGWIVPKWNATMLAKKVRDVLMLSPERKHEICSQAQNRIVSSFTLAEQARLFSEFFQDSN